MNIQNIRSVSAHSMKTNQRMQIIGHIPILVIVKVDGLDTNSLRFIFDYLSCIKQRTKMGFAISNWSKVLRGIPQGSILGPLLFNIFINDIFFFIEKSEICNFADDNTLYSCDKSLLRIKENLIFI